MSDKTLGARAELALMGLTVKVLSPDELKDFVSYICKTLGKEFNSEMLSWYTDKNEAKRPQVHHIVVNTVMEMPMITFTLSEEGEEYDLLDKRGVFSYVLNLDEPLFSEYGYTFFAKKGSTYRRIG